MDNKEYVLEKVALNYAGGLGRFLAKMGNKNAQKVIEQFEKSHSRALSKGYTTKNLSGFMKEMNRDPITARNFVKSQDEARRAAKEAKNAGKGADATVPAEGEGKQWSIFKPWSKKAKVTAGVIAAGSAGAGAGFYMYNKSKPQQATEDEYAQMMSGQ